MGNDFVFNALPTTVGASTKRSLSALRAKVRKNLLNDAEYYTDEDINNAINRAYDEIAEQTQAYILKLDQDTIAGQYVYDGPEDRIQITEVMYDNFRLDPEDLSAILNQYSMTTAPASFIGIPSRWADYNMTQIWLSPTPGAVKTLSMFYAAYPTPLYADGDVSIFAPRGDRFLINYATSDLLLLDNEINKSAIYEKHSREDMDHIKRLTKNKPTFANRNRDFDNMGGF